MKHNTIKLSLAAALLLITTASGAQSKHEVRLGVGDMCFETLVWHDQLHKSYAGTDAGFTFIEDKGYKYTPHFSAEYSYHLFKWMSLGIIVNYQNTSWTRQSYNSNDILQGISNERFFNLAILPTIRFNYLRREHFGMYSSLSFGLDINGGSETNGFGKTAVGAFGADIRLIGLRAGGGPLWAYIEFGALAAMQNTNIMYLLGSELARAGVSFKF